MGWGQNPETVSAAERARDELADQIAARQKALVDQAMTPFERRLLALIEELRDAELQPSMPGPVLCTVDAQTTGEVIERIRRALPAGSIVTGPNGPILSVQPLDWPNSITRLPLSLDGTDVLVDQLHVIGQFARPNIIARLREWGGGVLGRDFTDEGLGKIGDAVIDALIDSEWPIVTPETAGPAADPAGGGDSPPPPATRSPLDGFVDHPDLDEK